MLAENGRRKTKRYNSNSGPLKHTSAAENHRFEGAYSTAVLSLIDKYVLSFVFFVLYSIPFELGISVRVRLLIRIGG